LSVFVPHCGIVVQAAAYEREFQVLSDPGEEASEQAKEEYQEFICNRRAEVLLPFLPLVEMQKSWKGRSWMEICNDFTDEETKADTFILAMFQGPDMGKKHTVLNQNRYYIMRNAVSVCCVLCAVCCVRCAVCSAVCCVLCAVCCVLCAVCCVLCAV
jgi:hypothetical protein